MSSRPLGWRPFAWVALWTVNFIFLAVTFAAFLFADIGVDWDIYTEAGRRFWSGGLYDWGEELPYRYSPLLAPLFGVIAPIGYLGWSALHFAALLALPRRIIPFVLLAAPFWNDVYNGNTNTFVFVAAWTALAGSRTGTVAFFALAILIPRPVMLPVLGYLLWTRREWLAPFAAMAAVGIVGTWLTGWVDEWIASEIANLGRRDIRSDIGPSVFLGSWWYPLGVVIAGWLVTKGRIGFASFLSAGYWSLGYALMILLELRRKE